MSAEFHKYIMAAVLLTSCIQGLTAYSFDIVSSTSLEAENEPSYQWAHLTHWSGCNATCDVTGYEHRKRHCLDTANDDEHVNVEICRSGATTVLTGDADDDDGSSSGPTNDVQYQQCTKTCPMNGGWSSWTEWGACSVSAGSGHSTRTRSCNNPVPQHGGHKCHGNNHESQTCLVLVNMWESWGAWSQCDVTCGSGKRSRSRVCSTGSDCIGSQSEVSACYYLKACIQPQNVIDGNWGSWSNYSDCSKTCDTGVQFRTRQCDSPAPQNGGANCTGSGQEFQMCNLGHCAIDGNWGSWSNYSECSKTCDTGVHFRTRQCDSPAPQNGGANCTGSGHEFQMCNIGHCAIDGGWGNWTDMDCSSTCGLGVMATYRKCDNPAPQYGGKDCDGVTHKFAHCMVTPCPVHGNWSTWGNWSSCSVTSGSGIQTRDRICNNPLPQHGGHVCVGSSQESKQCTVNMWTKWSEYSQCTTTCGSGTHFRTRLCMTGNDCTGELKEVSACELEKCLQVIDGGWGNWTKWSDCSATCGHSTVTRTRLCDSPAPANGGIICTGSNVETEICGHSECPVDGGWSEWTQFSDCGSLCGYGHMTRTRACTNPSPVSPGIDCIGGTEERLECENARCLNDMPTCNKDTVRKAVASREAILPLMQPPCSNMEYIGQKMMLTDMCSAPQDERKWKHGQNVRTICSSIPLYSPLISKNTTTNMARYGVILDCYQDMLKIATEACDIGVYEEVIDLNIDQLDFFTVTW